MNLEEAREIISDCAFEVTGGCTDPLHALAKGFLDCHAQAEEAGKEKDAEIAALREELRVEELESEHAKKMLGQVMDIDDARKALEKELAAEREKVAEERDRAGKIWNEAIESAAAEVETHWNDSTSMINQRAQAFRSASVVRNLKKSSNGSEAKGTE